MAANAEIFFEHDRWGRDLSWSLGLQSRLRAPLCSTQWSRPAAVVKAGVRRRRRCHGRILVSDVPLPANPVKTENVLATVPKGLTQSQPDPVEKKPEADKAMNLTPKNSAKPQPEPVVKAR